MDENRDLNLDKALGSGRDATDRELATLVEHAELLRAEYRIEAPAARHERAIFVQGVAAQKSAARPVRFLIPATVLAIALFAVALLGRTAVPGQSLYAVREALASVGLARSPSEEIERRIDIARENLDLAESLGGSAPGNARNLVFAAIGDLDRAKAFLTDVSREERTGYVLSIDRLEDRAAALIVSLNSPARSDGELEGEDNSGPGGDDEGDDVDNSGPGNGDDDNSGPGGGDDNSGPGSGDDDADDRRDRLEDQRDEERDRQEDLEDDRADAEEDSRDSSGSGDGSGSGDEDNSGSGDGDSDSNDDSSGSGDGDDDNSGSG